MVTSFRIFLDSFYNKTSGLIWYYLNTMMHDASVSGQEKTCGFILFYLSEVVLMGGTSKFLVLYFYKPKSLRKHNQFDCRKIPLDEVSTEWGWLMRAVWPHEYQATEMTTSCKQKLADDSGVAAEEHVATTFAFFYFSCPLWSLEGRNKNKDVFFKPVDSRGGKRK